MSYNELMQETKYAAKDAKVPLDRIARRANIDYDVAAQICSGKYASTAAVLSLVVAFARAGFPQILRTLADDAGLVVFSPAPDCGRPAVDVLRCTSTVMSDSAALFNEVGRSLENDGHIDATEMVRIENRIMKAVGDLLRLREVCERESLGADHVHTWEVEPIEPDVPCKQNSGTRSTRRSAA